MGIRLTDEIIEKIDKTKTARLKGCGRHGIGVNVQNSMGHARVYINENYVCEFEDFFRVAKEFQLMADVLKDVTGIYIDE